MPFYGTGTILFEDDFSYSDGALATVGSDKWTAGYWTGQPSLRVVSNKAAGPASSGWSDCYSDSSVSVGATGIELIATNISRDANTDAATFTHVLGTPAASPSGYHITYSNRLGSYYYSVGKLISGSFNTIITTTQIAVDGDDIALQILPDGTISLFRKPSGGSWGQIGSSVVDTTYTSGVVALEAYVTAARWDRIEVRAVPGASGPVAPTITWQTGTMVASTDSSAPYTATGTLPTHVAGDILIACACKNNGADLTCDTSGWAEIVPAQNNANFSTAWFWKRATSSSEPDPVITSSTAGSNSAGIYVTCGKISGCIETGTPFEDATLNGSPTSSTTPASSLITTTGAKRLAVAIAQVDDDPAPSSGFPPATWATGKSTGNTTGGDASLHAIHKTVDSAGDVAAVTIGTLPGADYWRTLTLAFIPVPVASTSRLKRWNGSEWVSTPIKFGSGWPEVVLEPA